MHFQTVLLLVGGLHDLDKGKLFEFLHGVDIHIDEPQGRGETGRRGQGHAL